MSLIDFKEVLNLNAFGEQLHRFMAELANSQPPVGCEATWPRDGFLVATLLKPVVNLLV